MADITMKVRIRGIQPMLMHNNQACNPLNQYAKAIKAITAKRKKTDEDYEALARIEWEAGLYYTPEIGVFIPAANIEAMLREAAKKNKQGKDVQQSVRVLPIAIPVKFPGSKPGNFEEMKKAVYSGTRVDGEDYIDIRPVGVRGSSVNRARPRFNKWEMEFEIVADDAVFNQDDLHNILAIAGSKIGVGDYRPRYGLFETEILKTK